MIPLNQKLYDALRLRFGHVEVADPGVEFVGNHISFGGKIRLEVSCAGEYYRISCPYCGDTNRRLWINHRWGVRDSITGGRHRWLAHCFNENCLEVEENRIDLIRRTSRYHREAGDDRVIVRKGSDVPLNPVIRYPWGTMSLAKLPQNHRAYEYLRGRGFDPEILIRDWDIGYSREVIPHSLTGWIVVPMFRPEGWESVYCGWQARAIDRDTEEKYGKYHTAKGMKKSHILYGLDVISEDDEDPVLICEGITDVWRACKNAIALLGKTISDEQVRLIRKYLRGRRLVVALDPDAQKDAHAIVARITGARAKCILFPDSAPVVNLQLPGKDPGDCSTEELWHLAGLALKPVRPKRRPR